ncbi:HvfC/BufC N-terminal domain-containing protein [Jhaorihella thermophila]|uniref:Putative DNA-binding domain-containing protein n=1 Tax=Jhaorihella thermophila TaxID=488547 RepID=A0A1H5T3W2_9RHOB|nr:DNA-binding domain-containing protein [Jhaorihella thermophila]SEF57490.1 Putative DNA-binding domain-containing protein [Jhaorihella thermophila]
MTVSQADFAGALLDATHPPPQGLRDGQGRPTGRRFDVYRNNVAVSLTEALLIGFPVTTRLLGEANMRGLAGIFLRRCPPSSPLMMFYGDGFPAFLGEMEQLSHLGYLPDVARLELAIRRAYHAADAAPIDPAALAPAAPAALLEARMRFAPAMRLVRSAWPIFDIWRFNMEPDAPKPRAIAQDVLVTRPEFDPAPAPLPSGGADWIAALQAGATIAEALETTRSAAPGFDPTETLTLLIRGGAITALT